MNLFLTNPARSSVSDHVYIFCIVCSVDGVDICPLISPLLQYFIYFWRPSPRGCSLEISHCLLWLLFARYSGELIICCRCSDQLAFKSAASCKIKSNGNSLYLKSSVENASSSGSRSSAINTELYPVHAKAICDSYIIYAVYLHTTSVVNMRKFTHTLFNIA